MQNLHAVVEGWENFTTVMQQYVAASIEDLQFIAKQFNTSLNIAFYTHNNKLDLTFTCSSTALATAIEEFYYGTWDEDLQCNVSSKYYTLLYPKQAAYYANEDFCSDFNTNCNVNTASNVVTVYLNDEQCY